MPGLPMIGHGQVEGFTEKYGMEFRRAQRRRAPNDGLVARFEREIVPLLHDRWRYADAADFRLYDVTADGGAVLDDVFAYSNGRGGDRSLIVYHNRFASVAGWVRDSVPFAVKAGDGSKTVGAVDARRGAGGGRRTTAHSSRSGTPGPDSSSCDPAAKLAIAASSSSWTRTGCLVLGAFREVHSSAEAPWDELAHELGVAAAFRRWTTSWRISGCGRSMTRSRR